MATNCRRVESDGKLLEDGGDLDRRWWNGEGLDQNVLYMEVVKIDQKVN